MEKILKILGKKGRITIPLEIRQEMGLAYNDVISFERSGDAVTVRREKICDGCKAAPPRTEAAPKSRAATLTGLIEGMTPDELRTALIRLSVRWAEMQGGGGSNA